MYTARFILSIIHSAMFFYLIFLLELCFGSFYAQCVWFPFYSYISWTIKTCSILLSLYTYFIRAYGRFAIRALKCAGNVTERNSRVYTFVRRKCEMRSASRALLSRLNDKIVRAMASTYGDFGGFRDAPRETRRNGTYFRAINVPCNVIQRNAIRGFKSRLPQKNPE